jgi:hypothetical protein
MPGASCANLYLAAYDPSFRQAIRGRCIPERCKNMKWRLQGIAGCNELVTSRRTCRQVVYNPRDSEYAPRYSSRPEAPHPESDGSVTQATPPPLKRPHPLDKQPGSSSSHGSPHEQLCRHQPQPEDQQVSSRSEASDAPHSAMVAGVSAPALGAHGCSWRVGQCSANAAFAGAGKRLEQ